MLPETLGRSVYAELILMLLLAKLEIQCRNIVRCNHIYTLANSE